MEQLQDIFGNGIDLAAVASGAGLMGGGVSTAFVMMISGAFKRFIVRTLLTAVLTGVGFLFLLDYLGFEIVPPEAFRAETPYQGQSFDAPGSAGDQSQQRSAANDPDKRVYYVSSPFSD